MPWDIPSESRVKVIFIQLFPTGPNLVNDAAIDQSPPEVLINLRALPIGHDNWPTVPLTGVPLAGEGMFVITCPQAYRNLIHTRAQHKCDPKLGANAFVDRTASRNSDPMELIFPAFIQSG